MLKHSNLHTCRAHAISVIHRLGVSPAAVVRFLTTRHKLG